MLRLVPDCKMARRSVLPSKFLQSRHLQFSLHKTLAWKHSQYFFRQLLFLQWQPLVCLPCFASLPPSYGACAPSSASSHDRFGELGWVTRNGMNGNLRERERERFPICQRLRERARERAQETRIAKYTNQARGCALASSEHVRIDVRRPRSWAGTRPGFVPTRRRSPSARAPSDPRCCNNRYSCSRHRRLAMQSTRSNCAVPIGQSRRRAKCESRREIATSLVARTA